MLSCLRPRVPDDGDGAKFAHERKPLWACDVPSDAADVLRSIGLNRLANTVMSNRLTGHTLARLIDNIPAQHFLREPDVHNLGQHQNEAKRPASGRSNPASPQPQTGVPVVSVHDYILAESSLDGRTLDKAETSPQKLSEADEHIVDVIPSARRHLEEYSVSDSNSLHISHQDSSDDKANRQEIDVQGSLTHEDVAGAARSDANRAHARGVINVSVKPRNNVQSIAKSDYLPLQQSQHKDRFRADGLALHEDFAAEFQSKQRHTVLGTNALAQATGTRQFAASASLGVPQSIPVATQSSSSRVPTFSVPAPRTQSSSSQRARAPEVLAQTPPNPISVQTCASQPTQWKGEDSSHQKPLQDDGAHGTASRGQQKIEGAAADAIGRVHTRSQDSIAAARIASGVSAGKLPPLNGLNHALNSVSRDGVVADVEAHLARDDIKQGVLSPEHRPGGGVATKADDLGIRSEDSRKSPFEIARRRFADLSLPPNLQPVSPALRRKPGPAVPVSTHADEFAGLFNGSPPPPSSPEHRAMPKPESMSSLLSNGAGKMLQGTAEQRSANHGRGSLQDAAATYAKGPPSHLNDVQVPRRSSLAPPRTSVLINPLDRRSTNSSAILTTDMSRNIPPVGAAVQEGSPSELTRAHAKSNQPVGRFGVLYSDYRSDPTRPVNSAAREDAMTTASLSSSSQEVFDYGWAVAARSQWNSAEASVLPRQVLQDSTGTPASIILDDMLEKPPSLSYSRPSAPGIPPRVLEGSHFKWASQKSNDEPELERVRPELERVRRQPGSWANGSYLEEANRQRGDSGHAASLSGSAAVSTQAKPRVTVPKLWREGNTPRAPGSSVSTYAAYKVPHDVGEDSEFSSSDDDTSYGGKKV